MSVSVSENRAANSLAEGAEEASAGSSLLAPGDIVDGRYRVESFLSGGGMASVYRATHVGLEQAVAINAAPTCAARTCGFTCNAGFGNCDANSANGCEATLATDKLNCGTCGKSCGTQDCVNGACVAPPPPPPPAP